MHGLINDECVPDGNWCPPDAATGGLILPTKEIPVCTAAILDFCHVIITIKVLNHFRKVFRKVTTLNVLKIS